MGRKRKYFLADLEAAAQVRKLTPNERQALWTLRNPERAKEIAHATYERNYAKNSDKINARNKKWAEDNREQHNKIKREYQARRRAERRTEKEAYAASSAGLAEKAAKIEAARQRDRERSARYRAENPEKVKTARRKSREENREKHNAVTAAWRAANPDHVKAYQAEYDERDRPGRLAKRRERYAADPEPHRARKKAFAKAHPEYGRAAKRRRRAWKLAAGGTHTQAQVDALFARQDGLCANPFCTADLRAMPVKDRHLDHIKPLSRGGSDAIGNLQFLCVACNQRKTNFEPEQWLEREALRAAALLGLDADEVREAFICQSSEPALECLQITEVA